MSDDYTKLFHSILLSSVWREDLHVKVVWITLLALRDENHEIISSVPGLAATAGVTIEQCEEALQKFLSPDRHSSSQEYDGRRIEKIDRGWFLLNGQKYRDLASKADAAEKAALRQKRKRDRDKAERGESTQPSRQESRSVTPPSRPVTPRHAFPAETEEEVEADPEAVCDVEVVSSPDDWRAELERSTADARSERSDGSEGGSVAARGSAAASPSHDTLALLRGASRGATDGWTQGDEAAWLGVLRSLLLERKAPGLIVETFQEMLADDYWRKRGIDAGAFKRNFGKYASVVLARHQHKAPTVEDVWGAPR